MTLASWRNRWAHWWYSPPRGPELEQSASPLSSDKPSAQASLICPIVIGIRVSDKLGQPDATEVSKQHTPHRHRPLQFNSEMQLCPESLQLRIVPCQTLAPAMVQAALARPQQRAQQAGSCCNNSSLTFFDAFCRVPCNSYNMSLS